MAAFTKRKFWNRGKQLYTVFMLACPLLELMDIICDPAYVGYIYTSNKSEQAYFF